MVVMITRYVFSTLKNKNGVLCSKHLVNVKLPVRQKSYSSENFPSGWKNDRKAWKELDLSELSSKELYDLLISVVVPRPIALITSQDSKGHVNCAPFSYSTLVCHDPPLVCSTVCRRGNDEKDTWSNIEETEEWVHNVISDWYLDSANHTSGDFPKGYNELNIARIPYIPSTIIKPPRVGLSAVSMECVLEDKKALWNDDSRHTATMFIGKGRL